eukprot:358331-Chlamydomonas_euryale.AAC.4
MKLAGEPEWGCTLTPHSAGLSLNSSSARFCRGTCKRKANAKWACESKAKEACESKAHANARQRLRGPVSQNAQQTQGKATKSKGTGNVKAKTQTTCVSKVTQTRRKAKGMRGRGKEGLNVRPWSKQQRAAKGMRLPGGMRRGLAQIACTRRRITAYSSHGVLHGCVLVACMHGAARLLTRRIHAWRCMVAHSSHTCMALHGCLIVAYMHGAAWLLNRRIRAWRCMAAYSSHTCMALHSCSIVAYMHGAAWLLNRRIHAWRCMAAYSSHTCMALHGCLIVAYMHGAARAPCHATGAKGIVPRHRRTGA